MTVGMVLAIAAIVAGALTLLNVGVLATIVGVGLICAGLSKLIP